MKISICNTKTRIFNKILAHLKNALETDENICPVRFSYCCIPLQYYSLQFVHFSISASAYPTQHIRFSTVKAWVFANDSGWNYAVA